MTTRAAINGYGRIGRCLLRAAHERGLAGRLDVVAINELANLETMATSRATTPRTGASRDRSRHTPARS